MDLNPVENILYLADSYKVTHHVQYPPETSYVYSYFESRGGKFHETCFFGLQYLMKRWLLGPVVTKAMVEDAKEFYKAHFNGIDVFNEKGWMHIVEKHNGHLPLRIKAVPEGVVVPVKNVLFTVENTDPEVPWLTNWFETLLVQMWYPITVCTNSRFQKLLIAKYLDETSETLTSLPYKLHDFGYRGSTSVESAGIGDAAHLVNFASTDTVAGLLVCKKFYGCPMAGFTIPASEHSTMTAWGRNNEAEAYKNMLRQFPNGLVSVVSDSYDIYNAVDKIWCGELKSLVLERSKRGCLVIRPDSGDPCKVVVKLLEILSRHFPCHVNSKGFRLLPDYLRIIQGDGISFESLGKILEAIKVAGWSTENVVFGAGGALLQRLDRDTQKFAMKCSMATVNGEEINVYKQPVTDSVKTSKRGRLTLEHQNGLYVTMPEGLGDATKCTKDFKVHIIAVFQLDLVLVLDGRVRRKCQDLLVAVYENGKLLKEYTLDEIRRRAEIDLVLDYQTKKEPIKNGDKSML